MKNCRDYQEAIVELALGGPDAPRTRARALEAHLERCPECRQYSKETLAITRTLESTPVREDIESSPQFHRSIMAAVRGGESQVGSWTARWRQLLAAWPVLVPAAGVALVLLFAVSPFRSRQQAASPGDGIHRHTVTTPVDPFVEYPPTIASYHAMAQRSLERLEVLVASQANRNPPDVLVGPSIE